MCGSASGCRQTNPGFSVDQGSVPTTSIVASDPRLETQAPNPSSEPTREDLLTSSSPSQTTTITTQETTPSAGNSSSTSNPGPTNKGTGSSSGATERWTPEIPAPDKNAGDDDLCSRGSKGCFVFKNHAAKSLESNTPGYPGISLSITNAQPPASDHPATKAPLDKGLRISGVSTHIESMVPYPRYAGQDFGLEIWYRSDPNPNYQNDKSAMLVQVLSNIWIEENPNNGGIACGSWSTISPWHRAPHSYQVGPNATPASPRDQLRVAACVIAHGDLHIYSNGVMESVFDDPNEAQFRVDSDSVDQKIAVGGWVNGNSASENFQAFQGTVYMVRLWNNIRYMKDAMTRDLIYHGLNSYVDGIKEIPD